jgi:hypothetical protein
MYSCERKIGYDWYGRKFVNIIETVTWIKKHVNKTLD